MILESFYLYSLVAFTGSLLFTQLLFIPLTLKHLKPENAIKVLNLILPRSFTFGYVCGILSLLFWYGMVREAPGVLSFVNLFLLLSANVIYVLNGMLIFPKANRSAVESEMEGEALPPIWRVSLSLNSAVLVLCLLSVGISSIFLRV